MMTLRRRPERPAELDELEELPPPQRDPSRARNIALRRRVDELVADITRRLDVLEQHGGHAPPTAR